MYFYQRQKSLPRDKLNISSCHVERAIRMQNSIVRKKRLIAVIEIKTGSLDVHLLS